MARVFLIQPECMNERGHFYAALCSLSEAIGGDPWFVIHRDADSDLSFPTDHVHRHFSGKPVAPYDPLTGADEPSVPPSASRNAFTGELLALFERFQPVADDHLVFCSACSATVESLKTVIGSIDRQDWPHIHVRFLGADRGLDMEQSAHHWLSQVTAQCDRVHVYAEVHRNLGSFERLYRPDTVTLAPIPTQWPSSSEKVAGGSDVYTVGLLGAPRKDKGMAHLPAILREFNRLSGAKRNIRILLQKRPRFDHRIKFWLRLLVGLGPAIRKIEFLPVSMSNEEFASHLLRCDVVLLPYVVEYYVNRASGVAVDAVANGIPIVCRKGIAAEELIAWGNGLSAASDGELAEALDVIAADRDSFDAKTRAAAAAARKWRTAPLMRRLSEAAKSPEEASQRRNTADV